MKKRIISAAVIIPIVVLAIWLKGIVFHALVLFVALAGVYEMQRNLKLVDKEFMPLLCYLYAIAASVAVYIGKGNTLLPMLILFVIAALSLSLILPHYTIKEVINTVFVLIYPTSFILLFDVLEGFGRAFIIAGIIASVITDTAAFFVGRKFGTTKLCPEISPNKTVAGALGGTAAALILMPIYGIIFITGVKNVTFICVLVWIIFGFMSAVFAQFGDLFASSIKRYCGVKDFSDLIPGHGGILDRVDSVMFTSALVYIFKMLGII